MWLRSNGNARALRQTRELPKIPKRILPTLLTIFVNLISCTVMMIRNYLQSQNQAKAIQKSKLLMHWIEPFKATRNPKPEPETRSQSEIGTLKGSLKGTLKGTLERKSEVSPSVCRCASTASRRSWHGWTYGLLGGSGVVISGVIGVPLRVRGDISPLIWVISIVTLLITLLITTHEPLSSRQVPASWQRGHAGGPREASLKGPTLCKSAIGALIILQRAPLRDPVKGTIRV